MKKAVFVSLLLLMAELLFGQVISGSVIDDITNEQIPYVNVVMLQLPDSVYISGTITDNKGVFVLQRQSNSIVRFSFIGYHTQYLNVQDIQGGVVRLTHSVEILSETTVIAKRPFMKMEKGGISTDIQHSRLKNLGTASKVLSQLPLVREVNGSFEVFGKGSPLIYVNGRLIRDLSELERINSNEIKKVTVLTIPGPEYDASTKSVIKIEISNPVGSGLGGTLFGSVLQDKYLSPVGYANLNYRHNKLDIFGMVNVSQRKRTQNINWQQAIHNDSPFSVIENDNRNIDNKFVTANTGINYSFNSETSIGFKYEHTRNPQNKAIDITSLSTIKDNIESKLAETYQENNNNSSRHYINTYFNGKISPWLNAKLDVDFIKGDKKNNQFVTNTYTSSSVGVLSTEGNQTYNLFASKLVVTAPVFKGEASCGGGYSFTENKQHFIVLEQEGGQNLSTENNRSMQKMFTGFISYSKAVDIFQISAGLRMEVIDFKYYTNYSIQEGQSKRYHHWFPSFDISYNHEQIQLSLGYSKSISRPSYFQLRNNIQYNNLYAYESGNPYLMPTIDHCLSGSLKWGDVLFSANFDMYSKMILINSSPYMGEIIISKPENFDGFRSLTFSTYYSMTIGKWRPSIDMGVSKNLFRYGAPKRKYQDPVYSVLQRNSVALSKNLQMGGDIYCMSDGHLDFDYKYSTFRMDLYLSQTLFENSIAVNLFIRDVFNTDRYKTRRDINNISLNVLNNLNNRSLSLSVSYTFNATKKKYKGSSATDEIKRL